MLVEQGQKLLHPGKHRQALALGQYLLVLGRVRPLGKGVDVAVEDFGDLAGARFSDLEAIERVFREGRPVQVPPVG
jgi:hypothetical protein